MFSLFMQSPKYFPQAVLQEKWAGKEKRVWSMCERSEHWSLILSPSFFNIRRNGTDSQHGLQRIASMIAQKHDRIYSKTLHWIRRKLSYSLLHSAIMCLKGARSSIHHPATSPDSMDLAYHKGQLPLQWAEPTNIQTPCMDSTPFIPPFDWLNEFSFLLEKNSTL